MTERLGRNFILHTIKGRAANEVIISAHGGYSWDNGYFEVPEGFTVNFYNPNGAALVADAGSLHRFMVGAGFPVFSSHRGVAKAPPGGPAAVADDRIHPTSAALVHDYSLGYFEGDTAETIHRAMEAGQKAKEAMGRPEGPIKAVIAIDVLTVREGRSAMLGNAVELLSKRYNVIHCSFCRVNQAAQEWFPTYRPASATQVRMVSSGWWDTTRKGTPHVSRPK